MNIFKHLVVLMGIFLFLGNASLVHSFTAQELWAPYVVIESDWWSGGALHNQSTESETYSVGFYNPQGDYVGGKCITLEPGEQMTDVLQNFADPGEIGDGRYSVYIRTIGASLNKFSFTLFVANTAGTMGFGFQTYNSEDFETNTTLFCNIITPPIIFAPEFIIP